MPRSQSPPSRHPTVPSLRENAPNASSSTSRLHRDRDEGYRHAEHKGSRGYRRDDRYDSQERYDRQRETSRRADERTDRDRSRYSDRRDEQRSRRHDGTEPERQRRDHNYSRPREDNRRERGNDRDAAPHRTQENDRYNQSHRRRSSHSPDFEAERRRERARYEAEAGLSPARSQEAQDDVPDVPDFAPSGLLAKESNQVNGTALKYHEPPEAKKPKKKWRLYCFKGGEEVDLIHVSRQSCYLFGRDRGVVDVPLDHASCSKQHAVLQFRLIIERNEFGDEKRNVKPFILDLESANGTTVNARDVPASRYYELKNGDTVRFAASEREWVLLCEDV